MQRRTRMRGASYRSAIRKFGSAPRVRVPGAKSQINWPKTIRKKWPSWLPKLKFVIYGEEHEKKFYANDVASGLYLNEKWAVSYFPRPRNSIVLDIGAGAGREAIALAGLGYSVFGIDASEGMTRIAAKMAKSHGVEAKTKFAPGIFPFTITFPPKSFEVVFMPGIVLSHLTSNKQISGRTQRIIALREAAKVVKPNGIIAFDINLSEKSIDGKPSGKTTLRGKKRSKKYKIVYHGHTIPEVEAEIAAAGLEKINHYVEERQRTNGETGEVTIKKYVMFVCRPKRAR